MGASSFIAHSPIPPRLLSYSNPNRTRHLSPQSPFSSPSPPFREISLRPNVKQFPFTTKSLSPFLKSSSPRYYSAFAIPFSGLPSINLSEISPLTACKWAAVISIVVAATRRIFSAVLDPFFWMYFSWAWIFWPWILSLSSAIYGLYCLKKHAAKKASFFEQLAVVTSSILWLTLVAPGHFNGFIEGWPVVFFFVYHYFFFFESTVRKRLYGDLYPRKHEPKWEIRLPIALQAIFSSAILILHWLAAWEGPELHLLAGGWANYAIWGMILAAIFMRYHSILYLAKYTEKISQPMGVAQFGPYRWVRHPIYASTMLLFSAFFLSLRAPICCLLLLVACSAYYGKKAELEEELMAEAFPREYAEYASKVRFKLIPMLY